MCEPTTIALASLAVGVAGAGLGYYQQEQAADARDEAIGQNEYYTQLQLNERQKQINANAADESSARTREARIERGRIRVAAGESGLVDNSGRILAESFFNEGTDIASIESNRAATSAQNSLEKRGAASRARSDMNMTSRPTLLNTGLQIAGVGLNYAERYPSKPKTGGTPSYSTNRS